MEWRRGGIAGEGGGGDFILLIPTLGVRTVMMR
jgi:hypothetical protein